MNISWICSEAVPYAKTGGLADVSASLPSALASRGNCVSVIMPYYPQVMGKLCEDTQVCYEMLKVPFDWQTEFASIRKTEISANLTYYFIEFNKFFDRPFLYDYYGSEFGDNADRFIFFSRAAMQAVEALNLNPDILHTNDWHTALCNVYLKSDIYRNSSTFQNCRSVLTIHNIGYQGVFHKDNLPKTGLPWDYFNYTCLEYYDQLNFLKGGILTADMVTTVSPTYAEEILTPDYAFSLEGALGHVHYHNRLRGILNGICTDEWNPETDKLIAANYSSSDLSGKWICKEDLQRIMNLELRQDIPLIGVVSRFAYQKGIDVFANALHTILEEDDLQVAVLGSGDPELEFHFSRYAADYPGKFGVYIGYDNTLAHKIEAGSDFFVMPSRYEPCGLNQMYSMQYGTLPVVRETGGLKDTVVNYDINRIDESTGFTFLFLNEEAVINTLRWGVKVYNENKSDFYRMVSNGMNKDFSWNHTASEYEDLYRETLQAESR
jgi:starch synthase